MSGVWDWAISLTIIGGGVLAIWARVSRQTIPELLAGIRDAFSDNMEDTTEAMVTYE